MLQRSKETIYINKWGKWLSGNILETTTNLIWPFQIGESGSPHKGACPSRETWPCLFPVNSGKVAVLQIYFQIMSYILGKRMDPHYNKNFYPFSNTCLLWLYDFPRRDRGQNGNGDCLTSEDKLMKLVIMLFFFLFFFSPVSRVFPFHKYCHLFCGHFGSFAQWIGTASFSLLHWSVWSEVMRKSPWGVHRHWVMFPPEVMASRDLCSIFFSQYLFYLWHKHYHQQTFTECLLWTGF